jgi:hypothetical protein
VALAGAAVAVVGCASVPAPKTEAATHPPASAAPGTSLAGATSAARPTPEQRAAADTDAIFAAFVVPPGARELSSAPSVSGGVLQRAALIPGTPDLVDKAGWWLTPGAPQQVLAWETKHLPHRFAADGSGSSGAPGPAAELFDTFSLRAVYGVLDSRGLLVQAVADGNQTAVRVDAQVSWTPARPVSEKVPAAAKAVTVSEDLGANQGKAKPPTPVTVTDPAKVRKLVALINGLPLTQPGISSCPAGFGDTLTLTFRVGPGTPALAVATAELSGCPLTRFSIGGKQQPALAGASGPQILRIAGLPWKIPTS